MLIDCNSCVMRATAACDDCIVTFLLDRPEGAIVFDAEEERALRTLSAAGLTPVNRYTPSEEAREGAAGASPSQEVIPLDAAREVREAPPRGDDEEDLHRRARRLRARKLA